jgi:hypothetical protein
VLLPAYMLIPTLDRCSSACSCPLAFLPPSPPPSLCTCLEGLDLELIAWGAALELVAEVDVLLQSVWVGGVHDKLGGGQA